jgi:hypothetical protein
MTNPVFSPWNAGLGDQIATISLLARRAEASGEKVHLSDQGNLRRLHHELITVLAPCDVVLHDAPGTVQLSGFDVWAAEPWPVAEQYRWTKNLSHHYFVYQFDGISSAKEKNPPDHDVADIFRAMNGLGMQGVALGHHLSIKQCVLAMQNAAFFVGCDSGFSHLAHCVGMPTFILEYQLPIVTTHRNKPHIPCAGARDFIDHKLKTWISYRDFLGLGL